MKWTEMKWTLLEMTAKVETERGDVLVVAVDASRFDASAVAEIVGDAVMLVAGSDEPREYDAVGGITEVQL